MTSELLIYQQNVIDTYLYFTKENLSLIRNIYKEYRKSLKPYNSDKKWELYSSRAKHLQVMSLIGITAEHLVKIILLKRGFVLNVSDKVSFKTNLKSFDECISLFAKSKPTDYYNSLKTYTLNPYPDDYNDDDYLGYREIKPEETLKVIQKMRNSYLHLAEAQDEQQGIVWYLFNFLIWLSKKEYPNFFKDETYIGNDKIKKLFGHNESKN